MASPAPALAKLKAQCHTTFGMETGLLGIMGDARHMATVSDHNQGDALDIPTIRTLGFMRGLVALLLLDHRTHYCIFNKVFYHVGRAPAAYHGSDPHTSHIHMSIHPTMRADAAPWVIEARVESTDHSHLITTKATVLRHSAGPKAPAVAMPLTGSLVLGKGVRMDVLGRKVNGPVGTHTAFYPVRVRGGKGVTGYVIDTAVRWG